MAAIALRSPYYVDDTAGTGANSTKLTLTIEGNLEYTLVKETTAGATMLWEISELCRDFLNITYDGTIISTNGTITIVAVITSHASTDGTGAAITTERFPATGDNIGYDAYGLFSQGANPFNTPTGSIPTWLVSKDPNGTLNNEFYIYAPEGETGSVPYITTGSALGYNSYTSSQTEITGTSAGTKMNIIRVDCTKYGIGHKVVFVNKFGALQELWFFLKIVDSTTKKQEKYQRNTIRTSGVIAGTYSQTNHTKRDYNTTASQNLTLSSGYYPEWCNQWFEQLMLSEQVWIHKPKEDNPSQENVLPVNVKTSNFLKKTSLNDKLIEYTFDFELSANYINDIR